MSGIIEHIREIAGTNLKAQTSIFDAKVISVSTTARTCVVERLGGQASSRLTARLMASVDDGCLMIPAVDSTVIVCMSDYVEPYVTMFSEVDSIVWLGGEYDGVPIVTHPTNANKGLLKRLNNVENAVRSLINNYNSHVHVLTLSGGITGTAAPTVLSESTVLVNTAQSDIEHPNITH